ncbi:MAG: hypothetical protein EHM35_21070, partial [Planctomycetaceae bacterium]
TNTAGTDTAILGAVSLSDATLHLATIGTTARMVVTNLTTGGAGNTLRVGLLPAITAYPAQFRLIDYDGFIGGSGFNFTLAGLAAPYSGYLSNNTAQTSVDLVVTAGPVAQAVTWTGSQNGNWDSIALNWRVGAAPTNFFNGDFATFDNSAPTATTVNLTGIVVPGAVAVNSTLNYTFSGAGGIAGLGELTKQGPGTLTLNNSGNNSYAGMTTISGGILQVGNGGTSGSLGSGDVNNNAALVFNRSDSLTVPHTISGSGALSQSGAGVTTLSGANTFGGAVNIAQGTLKAGHNSALGTTNGATTISSGATLDVGANNINLGLEPIFVSGSGVGDDGAIINSSGSGTFVGPNVAFVTMTGNTTFGGTGRWDLRSSNTANPAGAALSTGGNPFTLTKVGPNGVYLPGVTVDPALGDVDIREGLLAIESGTTGIGNPDYTLTVRDGATLQLFNMTNLLNKRIVLNGTGTNNTVNNASGANLVIGPITLNGDCIFSAGGTSLTLSNVIG